MKKKSVISLGPGAPSLILIFVVLALCMLGMLALMNGRNDASLSERSVEVIEAVYALGVKAEETRAVLDALLAQAEVQASDEEEYLASIASLIDEDKGMVLESVQDVFHEAEKSEDEIMDISGGLPDSTMELSGREIRWIESDGIRNLHCAVEILPRESNMRSVWIEHTLRARAVEEAEEEDMFDW